MGTRESGAVAGLRSAAVGAAATGIGGFGSAFFVYEAVWYAGLAGSDATFQIRDCETYRSGRSVTLGCRGTAHARQDAWPTWLDEMPRSSAPGQTVQVRCEAHDCRRPDTGSAAGCVMGFCITLAILCAGLVALLTAARSWLGPDFARITHPRHSRWVHKSLVTLVIATILLFFGSAAVLLTSAL